MKKTFGQIVASLIGKLLGFKQKADEEKAREEEDN